MNDDWFHTNAFHVSAQGHPHCLCMNGTGSLWHPLSRVSSFPNALRRWFILSYTCMDMVVTSMLRSAGAVQDSSRGKARWRNNRAVYSMWQEHPLTVFHNGEGVIRVMSAMCLEQCSQGAYACPCLCRAGFRVIMVLSRTAVIVRLPSFHSVSVTVTSRTVSMTNFDWSRLL